MYFIAQHTYAHLPAYATYIHGEWAIGIQSTTIHLYTRIVKHVGGLTGKASL